MDINGRPDHIQDVLIGLHSGQWFGWSDPNNKIYANLVIHSADAKPTESQLTNALTAQQTSYDNTAYARTRADAYPSIGDQLDALFHADVFPDDMAATLQAVKDKYPKP